MTSSLFGERSAAAAIRFNLLTLVAGWFARRRIARKQRLAIGDLMQLDPVRLEDLGLSRQDVLEAARRPARLGDTLSRHRSLRAARTVSRYDART